MIRAPFGRDKILHTFQFPIPNDPSSVCMNEKERERDIYILCMNVR
jgi:hypothetical protein